MTTAVEVAPGGGFYIMGRSIRSIVAIMQLKRVKFSVTFSRVNITMTQVTGGLHRCVTMAVES